MNEKTLIITDIGSYSEDNAIIECIESFKDDNQIMYKLLNYIGASYQVIFVSTNSEVEDAARLYNVRFKILEEPVDTPTTKLRRRRAGSAC